MPTVNSYKDGDILSFTVNFNKAVTVTGTPILIHEIGESDVNAVYISGDNTSALVFAYTIVNGNTDANGIYVSSLELNGGTIKDTSGNDALLTLNSVGNTAGVLVDTTVPSAGNTGTIGISELAYNSAKLTWKKGDDDITLEANLQYKVIYSTSNITTVMTADALSGTWMLNITTLTVTGLTASTDYFFNVLVKDQAGNMALYSSAIGKTTAAPVYDSPSTPPTLPQNAVVEVKGEKQDAGHIYTNTTDGQTVTTITVDDTKLIKILHSKSSER